MPPRQLRALMREAEIIWQPYGVALTWVLLDRASKVLLPADTVRITRDDAGNRDRAYARANRRLGSVLFLGSGRPDNTVSLAVDAIRRIVDDTSSAGRRVADWPPSVREELVGRAIGRVLAHEIGHYLLIWRSHTADGLMRSDFRGEALIAPDRRAFELSDRLVPRLRARLAQLSPPGATVAEIR